MLERLVIFISITFLSPLAPLLVFDVSGNDIALWWKYGYGWFFVMAWFLEFSLVSRNKLRLMVLTLIIAGYGWWLVQPEVDVQLLWVGLPVVGVVVARTLDDQLQHRRLRYLILAGWWLVGLLEVGWLLVDWWWA